MPRFSFTFLNLNINSRYIVAINIFVARTEKTWFIVVVHIFQIYAKKG